MNKCPQLMSASRHKSQSQRKKERKKEPIQFNVHLSTICPFQNVVIMRKLFFQLESYFAISGENVVGKEQTMNQLINYNI